MQKSAQKKRHFTYYKKIKAQHQIHIAIIVLFLIYTIEFTAFENNIKR